MRRLLPVLVALGCGTTRPAGPACAGGPVFLPAVPGVEARLRDLRTWTSRLPEGDADRVLLEPDEIAALNRRNAATRAGAMDVLDGESASPQRIEAETHERLDLMRHRLGVGVNVEGEPGSFDVAQARAMGAAAIDEVRVVHTEVALRCVPMTAPLYVPPIDPDFDRNRCSGLHPAEVVRVLRRTEDGWLYVHAAYSMGWLRAESLTPPVDREAARRLRDDGPRLVVLDDRVPTDRGTVLRLGTSVPLLGATESGGRRVLVPTPEGLAEATVAADAHVREGFLPFTRRNVWTLAFAELDRPYGWGDVRGERDCSRLVLDVFSAFGLRLGRHSSAQADSGARTVELGGKSEPEKLAALREAGARGVVLVFMPGHIMLYLGEDAARPWAVSSLSEFLRPCDGGVEVVRIDRVAVTDLELGRGTDRTSFLERLERLAVFGP